uniref:T-complex protein 11-like protein 2 isoform X1 n=2 Tax=Myxine glutinosa TaxID=7769 RepID=UPI00358FE610
MSGSEGEERKEGKMNELKDGVIENEREQESVVMDTSAGNPSNLLDLLSADATKQLWEKLVLCHEIAVDENFCLSPRNILTGRDDMEHDVLNNTFWEIFEGELVKEPPVYICALYLLDVTKKVLLSFLMTEGCHDAASRPIASQIHRELDPDWLALQATNGALDLLSVGKVIIMTMASLCAPVRDKEVKELTTISQPLPLLRGICGVLSLMKADLNNFFIDIVRPHLQIDGSYEQDKLLALLASQNAELPATLAWLLVARSSLSPSGFPESSGAQEAADKSPGSSKGAEGCILRPNIVLAEAFLLLLKWSNRDMKLPETLILDVKRISALRAEVRRLSLMAAIFLVVAGDSGRCSNEGSGKPEVHLGEPERRESAAPLLPSLLSLVEQSLKTVGTSSCKEAECIEKAVEGVLALLNERRLSQSCPALPHTLAASLRGQIIDLSCPTNPVTALVESRLLGYIRTPLLTSPPRRLPPLPPALNSIASALPPLLSRFLRLCDHNRRVCGQQYARLLTQILTLP